MTPTPCGAKKTRKRNIGALIYRGSDARPTLRQRLAEQWMHVPGMTQVKLAALMGIGQPSVSKRLKRLRERRAAEYAAVLSKGGRKRTIRPMQLQFDV